MKEDCYLSEIYSAIQGEGIFVGVKQIFVRFSVCDLRCVWCDTPDSLVKKEYCEIEESARKRVFKKAKNPVSIENVISYVSNLSPELHHSVSFTGGEPLLQDEALRDIALKIKDKFSLPIYLETGGHRPDKLKNVIDVIDYISMDFKLPSSACTGDLWDRHKEFLEISLSGKSVQNISVKIVITDNTTFDDLFLSVNLIKSLDKNNKSQIILQPVTKINDIRPPEMLELLSNQARLLEIYPKIRVMPQVHKLIGER